MHISCIYICACVCVYVDVSTYVHINQKFKRLINGSDLSRINHIIYKNAIHPFQLS